MAGVIKWISYGTKRSIVIRECWPEKFGGKNAVASYLMALDLSAEVVYL